MDPPTWSHDDALMGCSHDCLIVVCLAGKIIHRLGSLLLKKALAISLDPELRCDARSSFSHTSPVDLATV